MKERKHPSPSSEDLEPSGKKKFFDWKKGFEQKDEELGISGLGPMDQYRTPGKEEAEEQLREHGEKTTDAARVKRAFAETAKDDRHAQWLATVKSKIAEFEEQCEDAGSEFSGAINIIRELRRDLEQGNIEVTELQRVNDYLLTTERLIKQLHAPIVESQRKRLRLLSSLRMELEKATI